ncbi:CKLF-like MARVEL transmembrane domain-containing protein 6 isoform X1 [Strigops habroptila]|uniref:CKLF like MARVEL transmembrane domain containing 6 n=1 Tax=Strigops habroptila TaxID=2489341 RepID=A0A672TN22_STRHB|nr:CKLF-like MARVEL transmembrane domain-containing protein 6 isoform X1 [Strigops habroptila]
MDNGNVYNETTEPQAKPSRCLGCTLRHLWGWRLPTKALQVIFSLLAVICEELVENCINCGGLYFFEFISCAAFLLSLLILCVYCTNAYEVFGKDKVGNVNIGVMSAIGVSFLVATIALGATSSESAAGKAASVFGFLASVAFLAESIRDCFHRRKQHVDGHSENPAHTPGATENQPLNQQS